MSKQIACQSNETKQQSCGCFSDSDMLESYEKKYEESSNYSLKGKKKELYSFKS